MIPYSSSYCNIKQSCLVITIPFYLINKNSKLQCSSIFIVPKCKKKCKCKKKKSPVCASNKVTYPSMSDLTLAASSNPSIVFQFAGNCSQGPRAVRTLEAFRGDRFLEIIFKVVTFG